MDNEYDEMQDLDYLFDELDIGTQNHLLPPTDKVFMVVFAIFLQFLPILLINLFVRLIHLFIDLSTNKSDSCRDLKNLVLALFGIYQLYMFLGISVNKPQNQQDVIFHPIHTIAITVISYTTLLVFCNRQSTNTKSILESNHEKKSTQEIVMGIPMIIVMLSPIIVNEYFIHRLNKHDSFINRSLLMTLAMKFATAWVSGTNNLLTILAYLLHPASCIFGPWHKIYLTKKEHVSNLRRKDSINCFMHQLLQSIMRLPIAFLQMMLSVIISFAIDSSSVVLDSTIISAYLMAFEFRLGHYSTCNLAMSQLSLWTPANNKEISQDDSVRDELQISDIKGVEWPRSLVYLAKLWNIPVHNWLKTYIFSPMNERYTIKIVPVLSTYIISCLLHGIKSSIWASLMSVAIFSYIEHALRSRLSHRLDACISSRPCKLDRLGKCKKNHRRTDSSKLVKAINFAFSAMALYHLTYISFILHGNSDTRSFSEVIDMWSDLNFLSIWINLGCLLISMIL